jgi:phage gp36-like protein
MAYDTVTGMIAQWGTAEMILISTPAGQDAVTVYEPVVRQALQDASDTIDSYAAKRYRTPFDVPAAVISRHCRILARYELMNSDQRTPSENAKTMRDETIAWLRDLSLGRVLLEAEEVPPSDESFAAFNDARRPTFGAGNGGFW